MDRYLMPGSLILVDLSTNLGRRQFANPVFVASGTFGYGFEVERLADISKLGAIVTKSVTLEPRTGNPPPRIVETTGGMINSIGLANVGVERYISDYLPQLQGGGADFIMNIAGSTSDEYLKVLEKVEAISTDIAGYEINISCPNVSEGGMEFGVSADQTARLTRRLRKRTERLLIMKLSPNVTDITAIGLAAQDNGADAVSAINTLVGMSIDINSQRPDIYRTLGGLSGPAIKPVGIASVYKLARKLSIPIIGIGGITSAEDVIEYTLAGASAVQIGTANFRDPACGINIINDLRSRLEDSNIDRYQSLIGQVKTYQ